MLLYMIYEFFQSPPSRPPRNEARERVPKLYPLNVAGIPLTPCSAAGQANERTVMYTGPFGYLCG